MNWHTNINNYYQKKNKIIDDESFNKEIFDWRQYIKNYSDLREAGIYTRESALNHWLNHGIKEGRTDENIKHQMMNLENFDWEEYIKNYRDLKEAGIDTKEKAIEHWINYGKKEGREIVFTNFENFDWEQYIKNYSDLRESGIDTKQKAFNHWMKHGKNEGRSFKNIFYITDTNLINFDLFDWMDYVYNYNDLKKAGIDTKEKAINHLVNHGIKEGRIFKYYEDDNKTEIENNEEDNKSEEKSENDMEPEDFEEEEQQLYFEEEQQNFEEEEQQDFEEEQPDFEEEEQQDFEQEQPGFEEEQPGFEEEEYYEDDFEEYCEEQYN